MNTKKCLIILSAIIIASALLLLTSCVDSMFEKPDPPEIEYGEFPFKITYKLNGEIYTVENVYICEYKGFGWNEGNGFYNKWEGYIKDTEDEFLFIAEQDGVKISCNMGYPQYYMGIDNNTEPYKPFLICKYKLDSGSTVFTSDEEYLKKFDIEILKWELSEPLIKNDDN